MGIRLGINGFGRIGRQVARIVADLDQIDLLAVNDPADSEAIVHLFKYDSTYGRFKGQVELAGGEMIVNGHRITVLQEPDPVNVKWSELGVDYVLEATGKFSTLEDCEVHLANGAKRVVLSAPSKGAMPTYVYGVNHEQWISDGKPGVISNASCTTNCLAPLLKVLNDNFTVQRGLMSTVHSYTNDQHLLDHNHKDLRRARSAAANIIPTTTGAAKAIGLVIPELAGKLDGFALRVPTVAGSVVDLTVQLERATSVDEINGKMAEAASGKLKGVLSIASDPIVSSDIIQDPHSSIFDPALTKVMDGRLAKVVSWYDNEWGYSCRCVDLIQYMAEVDAGQAEKARNAEG